MMAAKFALCLAILPLLLFSAVNAANSPNIEKTYSFNAREVPVTYFLPESGPTQGLFKIEITNIATYAWEDYPDVWWGGATPKVSGNVYMKNHLGDYTVLDCAEEPVLTRFMLVVKVGHGTYCELDDEIVKTYYGWSGDDPNVIFISVEENKIVSAKLKAVIPGPIMDKVNAAVASQPPGTVSPPPTTPASSSVEFGLLLSKDAQKVGLIETVISKGAFKVYKDSSEVSVKQRTATSFDGKSGAFLVLGFSGEGTYTVKYELNGESREYPKKIIVKKAADGALSTWLQSK